MKMVFTLSALTVLVLTQAGCATQVKSVALPTAQAPATGGIDVALYFGTQAHPAVEHELGQTTFSVRIARRTEGADASCDQALAEGMQKLRAYAHDHNGNAVINIKTSFHSTETASDSHYTCGVSTSAAALRVRGDVVVVTK